MLQSFVITLREGIEAALAIAIVLAYLRRTGRGDLFRVVYWALGLAVAMSLVGAVAFHALKVNTDASEGYFMVLGAVMVATMVYWMWRSAKGVKGEIEGKLGRLLGGDSPSADSSSGKEQVGGRRLVVGVFLFVFLMVAREGIETILFLSVVSLNSTAISNFIAGLLGLAAAVVFGVLFVRGSIRVNLRQFFSFTTAILFLVAAQLLIGGLHELSEAGVLPSSTQEMAIIGPIVNNDAYFFIAMLGLCGALFLLNRAPAPIPTADQAGRAAFRLQLAEHQRQQRSRVSGGLVALALCAALGAELAHERQLAQPPHAQPIAVQGEKVLIPVQALQDGNLHLFEAMVNSKPVRFMALRKEPGNFAAAFDHCSICRTTYFYQSGQTVVCSNCGGPLDMARIGEPGGCNPVPLKTTLQDNYLKIAQADLAGH